MARKFDALSREIILREAVKKKNPERANKAHEKVRKMFEFDERMKTHRSFMKAWNHWRGFYLELGPIEPKTSGQLTIIEKCIDFAKTRGMDLNMLIACVHKAFAKRKFRPSFQEIIARGEDHWGLYDDVMADLEKDEYERKSMDQ